MEAKSSNTKYMTVKQLQDEIAPMSIETIKHQISLGLPAVRFSKSGPYYFDRKEVLEWFKRHTVRAG